MSTTKTTNEEAAARKHVGGGKVVEFAQVKHVRGSRSDLSQLVGERIRTRRLELGWRQERLGAEFGVGRDSISRYENGQTEINASDLPKFAKVLRVPIAYFFGSTAVAGLMQEEGISFDGPVDKTSALDEGKLLRESRLLRHFTMLPPDFQESVILHARALERLTVTDSADSEKPKPESKQAYSVYVASNILAPENKAEETK